MGYKDGTLLQYEFEDDSLILKSHNNFGTWISTMIEDREGNLWITTLGSGVFILPSYALPYHFLRMDEAITQIRTIDNKVYIATVKGSLFVLNELNNSLELIITVPKKLKIYDFVAHEDKIYLASNRGVFLYNSAAKSVEKIAYGSTKSICKYNDEIIAVTTNRLIRFKDGVQVGFLVIERPAATAVYKDTLLIATTNGIEYLKDNELVIYEPTTAVQSLISSLRVDSTRLFIGTRDK